MKRPRRHQRSLFEGERLQMDEAVELTTESMDAYGPLHDHWAMRREL